MNAAAASPDNAEVVSEVSGSVQRRIGDYELIEELGRGGMGVVYKARQISLNRMVALKMILSGPFTGSEAQKRFHAEAEAAANLRHVHIVTIFGYGELEGVPYFTMEYVEGKTLARVISDLRFEIVDWAQPADLLRTIAEAVDYAHEQGVLHRDLKPSNILIDARGEPRVTDFGLAKHLWNEQDPTLTGQLLGSPNYMSPEQAAGNREAIGAASDVYALGSILYELLTGRPPFAAKSFTETLRQVVDQEPPLPRTLNPRIPRDLQTICLKCLEKRPPRRYPTARELADELQRFVEGEPIRARPVRWWERSWRWARRKPAMASAWGALTVVLLLGFAGVVSQWRRADLSAKEQRREAYFSSIALANKHIEAGDIDLAMKTLLNCPPEYRHWEWGRLVYLCHQDILTLKAIPDARVPGVDPRDAVQRGATYLTSLDFGGDDQHLVAHTSDGWVRAWSIASAQLCFEQLTPMEGRNAFAIRPGSDQLAIIAEADVAAVRRLSDGKKVWELTWPKASIRSLQYSPDGGHLLVASSDRVGLWDSESGEKSWELGGLEDGIEEVTFTADGRRLMLKARSAIRVHEVTTGAEVERREVAEGFEATWLSPQGWGWVGVRGDGQLILGRTDRPVLELNRIRGSHNYMVRQVFFSPDGQVFCSGGEESTARVWDGLSGRELFALPMRVYSARFSLDGRYLITAGNENTAHIWDAQQGTLLRTLSGHSGVVEQVTFNHGGTRVATGGFDGLVKLWTVSPGREVLHPGSFVWAVSVSPDGRRVVCAPGNVQLASWDADSGQELDRAWIGVHAADVAAMSPDGQRLVTGGVDKIGHVWDAQHFRPLRHLRGHSRLISGVDWSRNGRWIATASQDGTVRLWNAESGVEVQVVGDRRNGVGGAAFSHDSRWVVSCHEDYIQVWSVPDGRPRWRRLAPGIVQVAYSPTGRVVAGCCRDGTIRVWDARTGATQSVWTTRGVSRQPVFSPDGKRMLVIGSRWSVYGNDRGGMELWDVERGVQILNWEGHTQPAIFAVFTQDGRRIVTGSFDQTVRQWETFPWIELQYAGSAVQPLADRIQVYAGEYWRQRLAAEVGSLPRPTEPAEPRYLLDRSLWPQRDSRAQPAQIDLSKFYTGFLSSLFYPSTIHGGAGNLEDDLSEMGHGLMELGGVVFDVRGVIQLQCQEPRGGGFAMLWKAAPKEVRGIPIGRLVEGIHCLQAAAVARVLDGTPVATWVWHYADGSQAQTEVVYGRDLRAWWKTSTSEAETPHGRVAWTGNNPAAARQGAMLRLYLTTYENPHPDREVVSLDYSSTMTLCAPFLVALTVE